MNVYETIIQRRSIRRFKQKPIKLDFLKKMVNAARLAPSAANLQPVEFFIVDDKKLCEQVFETISWAGYIKPRWKPEPDERPVAYIVLLVKDTKNPWYVRDICFASENIVLIAEEEGLGSCIICKTDRGKVKKILKIPDEFIVDSLIALGYKNEKSVVEDFKGSVEYWRDEEQVLHVPKKKLEDIIHINSF